MVRMRSSFLALAPLLAIWLLAGCAGGRWLSGGGGAGGGGCPKRERRGASGSFVGKADPNEHAFVTVVAGEAEEGAKKGATTTGFINH